MPSPAGVDDSFVDADLVREKDLAYDSAVLISIMNDDGDIFSLIEPAGEITCLLSERLTRVSFGRVNSPESNIFLFTTRLKDE